MNLKKLLITSMAICFTLLFACSPPDDTNAFAQIETDTYTFVYPARFVDYMSKDNKNDISYANKVKSMDIAINLDVVKKKASNNYTKITDTNCEMIILGKPWDKEKRKDIKYVRALKNEKNIGGCEYHQEMKVLNTQIISKKVWHLDKNKKEVYAINVLHNSDALMRDKRLAKESIAKFVLK